MAKEENNELSRGLKARHLNMIAMGGSIGTGIFLAMGDSIHQAGIGGSIVAYGIIGIMVYFLILVSACSSLCMERNIFSYNSWIKSFICKSIWRIRILVCRY